MKAILLCYHSIAQCNSKGCNNASVIFHLGGHISLVMYR